MAATVEELFCDLYNKYGDNFNWHMLPFSNRTFVSELKQEIGQNHFLYHEQIYAVAKCDSSDEVLFVTGNNGKEDIYYVFHLTYSAHNIEGYPKYQKLIGIDQVKEYIESSYIADFL